MKIEIVRNFEADALLASEACSRDWIALCDACPWATSFQSHGFVSTWYKVYRERYAPLLLISRADDGRLQGVLPLATLRSGSQLVAAGAHQAEYQAWVCAPEMGDSFALEAVLAIRRELPHSGLTLRYLPAIAPTSWLAQPEIKRLCGLKFHRRPLMRFGDGREIEESLRKSGNKSRIRQLKKLGQVELKHLRDRRELEGCIDAIIESYDLRRMAVNGSAPFRNDRFKKEFHLALMEAPGVMHASVLKVGDQIASAHLNEITKKEISLGFIAHNAAMGRLSPGKIHLLLLAQLLMKQGYEQIDLTPGDDPYKERFANAWDDVSVLTIFPTPHARRIATIYDKTEDAAQALLKSTSFSPVQARTFAHGLRQIDPTGVIRSITRRAMVWSLSRRETRVYVCKKASRSTGAGSNLVRRNALSDLLDYRPPEGGLPRREFVAAALERIEEGQHIYTCVENGRLLHCAWLAERATEELARQALPEVSLPPDCALIYNFCDVAESRRQGLEELCLRAMLRDAARIPGAEHIVVAVPANSDAARLVAASSRFEYRGSLIQGSKLGSQRRWTETRGAIVAMAAAPAGQEALKERPAVCQVVPVARLRGRG